MLLPASFFKLLKIGSLDLNPFHFLYCFIVGVGLRDRLVWVGHRTNFTRSRLLHLGNNGEKTELIGGAPAGLWRNHPPGYGALIECINPTISASYAGELRKRGGEWGLWPIHIQDVQGGETRIIKESDLLLTEITGRERRCSVMPLYRSKPITATPYLALLPLVTQ